MLEAMKKIGVNKASSYDGMMDIIFQTEQYHKVKIRGEKPERDSERTDKQRHKKEVQEELAEKLSHYLNFCIKEKTKLMYNQDCLEQIYIPKDSSEWKCFYNARPITKTSPLYKLLDTIMNLKLQKELYHGKQWKLNIG